MTRTDNSCPMTYRQVVDRYFIEHRAKLIEIAAYLDRIDRTADRTTDHRDQALRDCIAILTDGQPHRARRILELLSDPTEEPIAHAHTQGATGAPLPKQD